MSPATEEPAVSTSVTSDTGLPVIVRPDPVEPSPVGAAVTSGGGAVTSPPSV
ncbi:hypothetical protein O7605_00380 [Verrucosispora sp. WMMA2121]|uniref:hypothetical protein n=1 Tax=Verrucosispora sp. WMMA2121 TaxID=3015164 RepID=UPI0022B62AC7|nr:hypothetical protein [Verrucosispora sp. WMMA2121]MCZ7417984.1 hypothetical protein [Verrucosispora sp. WMMA2121]